MPEAQGREALSVVHINVPREAKARWVKASQARGMKLTDWLIKAANEAADRSARMNVFPIPEALTRKYQGAGHALAAVTGGQVVDLVYLHDALPDFDSANSEALRLAVVDDRLAPTVRRLQALGEVSVGMCSGGVFVQL